MLNVFILDKFKTLNKLLKDYLFSELSKSYGLLPLINNYFFISALK